jgi:hypothetical protein
MYSTACHREKCEAKHNPQQAALNKATKATKQHQHLNYQTWKFSVKKINSI